MSTYCQPAARVIEICGGLYATAKIAGIHRSAVGRWRQPRERKGTGGTIPMRHARLLLAAVPELTPEDIIGASPELTQVNGAGS
jgi:hypothetical protein